MTFKQLKVSRVFLRFFLSFLSVLIIPLLILGTISVETIRESMRDNESQRNIAALSQCAKGVENELANISTIVFKASSEQDFSPYRMDDFINNSRSVISLLKNYKTANNFIREIYLFSPYSDYIFSTGTTYTYQRFITQKMPEIQSQKNLSAYLSNAAANTEYGYLPSAVDDTVFLILPLPSFEQTHYAYMIFEIPQRALLSQFKVMTDFSSASLMIFNHGVLLASSGNRTNKIQQLLQELPGSSAYRETGYLPTPKHQDPILFLNDEKIGLTYVLTMPETDAMIQINQVIRLFTIYLLLTALLGTFGIYLLAKINYTPIKKLAQSTNGFLDPVISSHPLDEIDHLYRFVKSSQSTYKKMNLELQDSLLATKYFFIKNLVNAHPYTLEEIQDMLKRTSMEFHGSNFFVVIFHIHKKDTLTVTAAISDFLSYFHTENITGYAASLYEENIVGIYSCTPDGTNCIKKEFELLHQRICTDFQVSVTIGIGGQNPDLSHIAASFLEASSALDCRFIMGKNKLIFFSDLKLDSYGTIDYPQNYMDKVCLSIKTGENQLLSHTLNNLFSDIRLKACSMHVAKSLCYEVTNRIIKILKEMADSNTGFEIPDLIVLTSFETVDDLEQMLCRYCKTACEFVNSLKPPSLSDMAIKLVSKNYAQASFSVSSVSEALGVSSSYLSHTFKEQQSITLNDYIKLYKIGLAKKMLSETSDSLEKIIHLLGYYDCSSFIRMFKKSEGMTPGEYRRRSLHGGNEE